MSETTIIIDGVTLEGFEATSIHRHLDSIADGFTFTGPYDPDAFNSELIEPYQREVVLKIDGEEYITAISEKWNPTFGKDSTVTQIECRSRSGALVDCTSTSQTTTYKKQTLEKIANAECEPFGIKCFFPDGDSPTISIAQRCPTDTIFSFLKKLACNFEFLINSTPKGNIKFVKPNLTGEPVDSFVQGESRILNLDVNYDFSKRYSEYTAVGQFPGVPDAHSTVTDTTMGVYRPIMFKTNAKSRSTLDRAAKWRKTRALISTEIALHVEGWHDGNGDLWLENELVSLQAPNSYLFNLHNYLIKNVVLDKTESSGETAHLTLVMPESFTGEMPEELPWER